MTPRAAAICALAALLAACARAPDRPPPLAAGATLILEKAVSVPAGRRFVWLQKGEVKLRRHVRLSPYCQLHLRGSADTAREIAPGRFTVAWLREDFQAAAAPDGMQLAGIGFGDGGGVGGDPLSISNELVMGLEAEAQPKVDRLICGQHQAVGPYLPPTVEQINAALGGYGRLDTTTAAPE
ncbi:hypothetical protein SAMN05216241_101297 [Limimonas halophila]|uniref:Lipoprotein n=1 Tax=Limimonas halophila TaxID=1082479 RepID=A0A1G7LLT1_9PROT|nr:hypothetical protein [Limimonas halophila]SDF50336.1 hypothetical protein SAMN05216241_101297 [Limimonas halophila]